MNRRSFLTQVVPGAAALSLLRAEAAHGAAHAELTTTDLAERLFVISGGGGNVTVFDSSEGVLLVDGGSPERSADVLKLVKRRTGSSKVHTLFNTHWHWDQTGSNATLGKAGTRIIAHENTRLWLTTDVDSKWEHRTYPPLPATAQPSKTFYTSETLAFGGETIEYGYLPQAHTDGDIYVFFKNANVLVAGDVVTVGAYPVSDYCTNGWIGGMANGTKTLLDLCDPSTRVVPGKGPVQTRADVEAENAMLSDLKVKLSHLLAQGMSAQDMIAAAPTRDYDAKWGDPQLFIANAWPGLVWRARELGVSIV
ncbi:MAG TPA: MBL fold metallo-hydrolase [Steroidobacteraceae bacterium]|jgi:cyclase|nr:MBL fold metallo-hydrolase [Steroidobacteraceae bacterium]